MHTALNKQAGINYAWLLFITIIGLIVWGAWPWQHYFLNDDYLHIPKACRGQLGQNNSLRPVGDLSLYIDSLWTGTDAFGYHLTNLLIHVANMLLIIPLIKKIAGSFSLHLSTNLAVVVASLFGIFAFHSEALFWILGRSASLSFFFNVLCWICFFKGLVNKVWLLPAVAFFLLGLFTYESLWVFPVLLTLWLLLLPKSSADKALAKWPLITTWLLFIAYFPIRIQVTGALLGTYEAADVEQMNLPGMAEKSLKLLMRSFLPPMENTKLFMVFFVAILILLLFFCAALIRQKKTNKLLVFLVVAWLISYLPYLSLGASVTGYESERYLYYPSFFLCAALLYAGVLYWQKYRQGFLIYMAALFMFHVFFFIKASLVFKQISTYSKLGMDAIINVPLPKKVVIKNLPAYSHGMPVFNYGLMNGVEWLAPGRDTLDVEVLSRRRFGEEIITLRVDSTNAKADTIFFLEASPGFF